MGNKLHHVVPLSGRRRLVKVQFSDYSSTCIAKCYTTHLCMLPVVFDSQCFRAHASMRKAGLALWQTVHRKSRVTQRRNRRTLEDMRVVVMSWRLVLVLALSCGLCVSSEGAGHQQQHVCVHGQLDDEVRWSCW